MLALATVATLSLSASTGASEPRDSTIFASAAGRGDLRLAVKQAAFGLSPYAAANAERAAMGLQGWTPTGLPGWETFDFSTPRIVRANLAADQARMFNALLDVTTTPVEPLDPFVLKADASDAERALHCLTQAIYYEAGFEPVEGQQAVAQVVLNRLRHPNYPKSVCGVVYQGAQRVTGCQFSFTCDGSLARAPALGAWERSREVAKAALSGFVYAPIGTATHYHADYVFPYWAPTLVKLKQIGAHIFYRMTGPAGSPDGFGGRYAGNEAILTAAVLTGGDERTPDAPSAIIEEPAAPKLQLVSLTVGGETRSYHVGDLADVAATPAADGEGASAVGMLSRARRAPTAEEIAAINAKLKAFEEANPIQPRGAVATE